MSLAEAASHSSEAILDETIQLPCPSCGSSLSVTVRDIAGQHMVHCGHCGEEVALLKG